METNGRTDRQTDATDCYTFPADAVDNHKYVDLFGRNVSWLRRTLPQWLLRWVCRRTGRQTDGRQITLRFPLVSASVIMTTVMTTMKMMFVGGGTPSVSRTTCPPQTTWQVRLCHVRVSVRFCVQLLGTRREISWSKVAGKQTRGIWTLTVVLAEPLFSHRWV